MIPRRLVELVLNRDQHRCVLNLKGCQVVASVADHRCNRGMGGGAILDDAANLLAACIPCNGEKENQVGAGLERLYRHGLKIKPSSTHAKSLERARITPVRYPDDSVCILTSSGVRLEYREVS